MTSIMKILLIFLGYLALSAANPSAARYDDFKIYRIAIKDAQEFNEFKKLGDNIPVRYLTEPRGPGYSYDVVIDPANQDNLEAKLNFLQFDYTCVIEDLQSVLEVESQTRSSLLPQPNEMSWTKYHKLPVIYKWLRSIATEFPDLVTSYVIGKSYEQRPIRAIKISSKPGNKAIFIESNIHAIEWISSATTTCFINNLLRSSDPKMKHLLENCDWIYVPVLNPDGFEYSHNVERLWRKNRKPTGFHNASGPCYGTDLNRNFDYEWGKLGYNIDEPCDHWYGGAFANSEPEVLALENFINKFHNISMYLAFHSFGNMILLPYDHINDMYPHNYDQMTNISKAFAVAAEDKYGTKFKFGPSGSLIYNDSGTAKDYSYFVKNIPYTATMELRDRGEYGFFLPPNQILEVCAEVTDGLIAMVAKAMEEGLFGFLS